MILNLLETRGHQLEVMESPTDSQLVSPPAGSPPNPLPRWFLLHKVMGYADDLMVK